MPQTRMFRDRVVSMEQTLEGGEKHLELLKSLCRDAFPEFEYRSHALDHERDLFVMTLASADGRTRTVGWTRMVLFDAERIPALSSDAAHALRARVVAFLRARMMRTEIVVTFRHLEEGWTDTPEPRRERRRRRGRGSEGRGPRRQQPAATPTAQKPRRPEPVRERVERPEAGGVGRRSAGPTPLPAGRRSEPGSRVAASPEDAARSGEPGHPGVRPAGSRRRRFRRRRRGRGGSGSGSPPTGPLPGPGAGA